MDGATITNLIGSLGFPIAAACFMAWFTVTQMKEFREALAKNTAALQELILMIRDGRKQNNDRKRNVEDDPQSNR